MQKKILYILLFTTTICFSQKNREILYGKVSDSIHALKNAHVVNLNTKQGTFTNDAGDFRIFAKENDTLQISSVSYKTSFFTPKSSSFGMNSNHIVMKNVAYELDEVIVKSHNLMGYIAVDVKQVPKDAVADLVNNMMSNIRKLNTDAIMNMAIGEDEIHLAKPNAVGLANSFSGIGTNFSLGGNSGQAKRILRQQLEAKSKLPDKILAEFGSHFFFKQLKIPADNYYHFLDYCSIRNIDVLFNKKEFLKLIKVFQEESIAYLETIKTH